MITKTFSALAIAAGLLIAATPAQASSSPIGAAVQKAGFKQTGFKKVRFKKFHHRKFKHSRRGYRLRHFKFDHAWHGYRGCRYYYRKARWTGSRYWWKRYRVCIAHQYYRY